MTHATRITVFLLGVICLLVTSGPAVAQNTLGKSDKANVKTQQYDDWQVRCLQSTTPKQCQMTQLVNNPNSNAPIMRVILEYPPQIDTAAMAFLLPLGTRLIPGMQINVGGGEPIRIPFQVCLPNGCRANLRVDDALLSRLKQGTEYTITLIGPRGEKINLPVSLMGFTAANNAIKP